MVQPLHLAVQDSKKENVNETRANINGSIHISGHVVSGGWQKDDIIVQNKLWHIMPSHSQTVLQSQRS